MKTIAYSALMYGKSYLGWAIRSVIHAVDEYHVLYTPVGSHGSRTDLPCPDSRDELYAIAEQAAGDKLHWHESTDWWLEHQQRNSIYRYAPDADVILILDSDEIWGEGLAEMAIAAAVLGVRNVRIPVMEFWRSFHYAEQRNLVFPERVTFPKVGGGEGYMPLDDNRPRICHLGYASPSDLVYFKQFTHGHRGDWREGWFERKFAANDVNDCHPTNKDYWFPTPVDYREFMPSFMSEHPYANLETIP